MKTLLGVKKTTSSAVVYCETGRFPLKVVRLFRIFKFWFKLLQSQNCILHTCYNMLREGCDHSKKSLNSWVSNLKIKLCEIGLGDFWLNQDNICVNLHFPVIKQRIVDIFVQSNFEVINCSSKCKVYMHVIGHFTLQYYLTKAIPIKSNQRSKFVEYVCHHTI